MKEEVYKGMLKEMFKKVTGAHLEEQEAKVNIPKGLWKKCNKCGQPVYTEDVKNHLYVCPKCSGYFRIHAWPRIRMVADQGTFEEFGGQLEVSNPLKFPGYEKKLEAVREKTGLTEGVVTGTALVGGEKVVLGVCDARFLMGSMGRVVGERITAAIEKATEKRLPLILFTCSGGARMQEGIISLMQMAKTAAALKRHSNAGLLYITVLTDPTTGGVTASFAMLGDIILAEPGALIGFAGPRVIEQTIGQKLPEGFQKAEFLLEHGFIDGIVERTALRDTLSRLLKLHRQKADKNTLINEKDRHCQRISEYRKKDKAENTSWLKVKLSRSSLRPTAADYIDRIFDGFYELHGDRSYRDDGAIIGGIAWLFGTPVTVIAQQKGKNTKDNIKRNFGMPYPEGYKKALRLMKQAEKFNRPVICIVDTPGAFCGIEAEERGQGEAIATNLFEMSALKVPILSIVIGEGGSGGALALAVADEVWMMENAIYSILSPEGFASILWKDSKRADEASKVMKITAEDLLELQIIERVIREPEPLCLNNLDMVVKELKAAIGVFIAKYSSLERETLIEHRYERFRRM